MLSLATYRRKVFSAPGTAPVYAEGRGDGFNPKEALVWRRSG
jgi:hypothetical protein